jgi:hypothetical protein
VKGVASTRLLKCGSSLQGRTNVAVEDDEMIKRTKKGLSGVVCSHKGVLFV